jgi:hypothetical protein
VIIHVTFAEGRIALADCRLQLGCHGEVNALAPAVPLLLSSAANAAGAVDPGRTAAGCA